MTQLLLQGLKMGPFEGVMWLVSALRTCEAELLDYMYTRCCVLVCAPAQNIWKL